MELAEQVGVRKAVELTLKETVGEEQYSLAKFIESHLSTEFKNKMMEVA